jgi:hypothetical protein
MTNAYVVPAIETEDGITADVPADITYWTGYYRPETNDYLIFTPDEHPTVAPLSDVACDAECEAASVDREAAMSSAGGAAESPSADSNE